LTHFLSKLFERFIYSRLIEYATEYNILNPQQFGFTSGKSTQDDILALTERIIYECFNHDKLCLNVFIDLQKAFDTISHQILLGKLELYGIKNTANFLIMNFLSNRSQSVRIKDIIFNPLKINVGLPQGTVLSSSLSFFINDLPNVSD